eukprot:TRINITY_DN5544_c0_g1_i3.p3 TRINITY_DN5544_c0_g1~~TRINITY_DN5544_c0_g1_i3.p3  ORF type:complete len:118 (-),score=1.90 TRINITY_DN5544_c0_g1_i3:115-468(-)
MHPTLSSYLLYYYVLSPSLLACYSPSDDLYRITFPIVSTHLPTLGHPPYLDFTLTGHLRPFTVNFSMYYYYCQYCQFMEVVVELQALWQWRQRRGRGQVDDLFVPKVSDLYPRVTIA